MLCCSLTTAWATGAIAQDKDAAAVKAMVEARNYVFVTDQAIPQSGRNMYLTGGYDLTIKTDSVIAYLPYFGRAYTAPVNPAEGGIKFTSTNFNYTLVKQKKHSWEIQIKPRDASDVTELYLTIQDNGSASLRVNSINRQSISFRGYVTAGKPSEKKAF